MDWQTRIEHYRSETKHPEPIYIGADGGVVGVWKDRAGLNKHIEALFPDKTSVLRLPHGIGEGKGIQEWFDTMIVDGVDLVYAKGSDLDPKVGMNVMQRLGERLTVGAHVVWLDRTPPMYYRELFALDAVIGVKPAGEEFLVITVIRRVA